MAINHHMSAKEWVMLIFLSVLWGGSFFFMKVTAQELPIFTIVFARVALASLSLFFVLRLTRLVIPSRLKLWRSFFIMGLINNVIPFSLLVWGLTEIASGLSAILNATTPLFTIFIAHLFTHDERISSNKVFGIILGIAGVVALIGVDALSGLNDSIFAMLACLGAALSYGAAAIFGRQFQQMGLKPVAGAFGQVTASSLILLPIVVFVDSPWTLAMPGIHTIVSLLALGLFSTALAYVLYFRILGSAGATNIALVTLLVPLSAIFLGWLVLHETLSVNHFTGMGLISFGLVAIDGRIFKKFLG